MDGLIAVLSVIVVVIGAGVLLSARLGPRSRCWRCRVLMLAVRIRERKFSWLPVGQCEGCGVWCFALGPHPARKSTTTRAIPVNHGTASR